MSEAPLTALIQALSASAAANIALMRLILAATNPAEVDRALEAAARLAELDPPSRTQLTEVARLWRRNPGAWALVRSVAAAADHAAPGAPADATLSRWSASFDAIASVHADAGGALYALGDDDLLGRATRDVVQALAAWNLLGPDREVFEIGCGSGRFVEALATRVRCVTGTDLSAGMLAQARRRCIALANVVLQQTSGQDLATFADGSVDLVLAADVFPYLVDAGPVVVATHFHEAARLLRPGGTLVILNFSYRGDPDQDRTEVARYAMRSGLALTRRATNDFQYWDGVTFQLTKPHAPASTVTATP